MTIWFDFTNPPHVNFFNPLINKFVDSGSMVKCTAREFVETVDLLKLYKIDFDIYGKHGGKKKSRKIMALLDRYRLLFFNVEKFDFSFSSNYEAPLISWLRRKPAFVFDDNDIAPNWLYSKFAKYVVSPKYIDQQAMYRMGIKPDQLLTYDGFKENIYIADYKPDPEFLQKLPFHNFVTVRPENIQATYVADGVKSIVPELITKLISNGMNVLYLPRYQSDKDMINNSDNIFVPEKPLNGLDVCYYSQAVLTGAGSFSREAAVFGTPAVSFFAGKEFLGVDKEMFSRKLVFYSRNPDEIIKYVKKAQKVEFNPSVSKSVQQDLYFILEKVMKSYK
jgi:uncharacterized protein